MKRKIVSSLAALLLVGAMAVPVSANQAESQTNVTYTEPDNYMISIPAEVKLSTSQEVSASITATEMNISPKGKLRVRIKGGIEDGKVTLTREGASDTTKSTVSLASGGTGIDVVDTVVAEFQGQSTKAVTGGTLYFSKLPSDLKAGTWNGQITFAIGILNQ